MIRRCKIAKCKIAIAILFYQHRLQQNDLLYRHDLTDTL